MPASRPMNTVTFAIGSVNVGLVALTMALSVGADHKKGRGEDML